MTSHCCNSLPTRSHFISSDFLRQLKTPWLFDRAKRRFHGSTRSSKVTVFYGLKAPPYKLDALEPFMRKRTIDVHWGELHRNFVEDLNKQMEKDDVLYAYTMYELVKETYNNENPLPEFNNAAEPIINLDLWEHAYYLDYKNDRAKYVNTFMDHLVSWDAAMGRLA